ncbi:MAG: lipoprotein [Flavobacteriales bacterium]|nr:lipoprotein [Flavobacteriales bacterium]
MNKIIIPLFLAFLLSACAEEKANSKQRMVVPCI